MLALCAVLRAVLGALAVLGDVAVLSYVAVLGVTVLGDVLYLVM